ncbi:hypothetical protein Tco_0064533 [Tanacetum coccineum]
MGRHFELWLNCSSTHEGTEDAILIPELWLKQFETEAWGNQSSPVQISYFGHVKKTRMLISVTSTRSPPHNSLKSAEVELLERKCSRCLNNHREQVQNFVKHRATKECVARYVRQLFHQAVSSDVAELKDNCPCIALQTR